jgi:hypothetical protein
MLASGQRYRESDIASSVKSTLPETVLRCKRKDEVVTALWAKTNLPLDKDILFVEKLSLANRFRLTMITRPLHVAPPWTRLLLLPPPRVHQNRTVNNLTVG